MDETNNTIENETPIEELENQELENQEQETTTKKTQQKQSFVKIREEKAREAIFKELGVKDIDEAKEKLKNADLALQKVTEIEKKLQEQEDNKLFDRKVKKLTEMLDAQNVFDADALVNYIDIDNVELDATGEVKDSETIINQLKKLKPNYFGKQFIKTDSYNKNREKNSGEVDYKTDYEAGNYQAVIAKFLKNRK